MTNPLPFLGGLKSITAETALSSGRLLWLAPAGSQAAEEEWSEALTDFKITSVVGIAEACAAIGQEKFDCALVTGAAEDADRIDLLETLSKVDPLLPFVFWDRQMSAAQAVRLTRSGAYHCLGHADTVESLRDCVDRAVEDRISKERARKRSAESPEPWRASMIGESRAMESVVEMIRLVGPRRCTVLISGESGTGKEIAARAIHMAGPRAKQPMVAINCAALPENLLEAELFGHVKGAFTGAINVRVGRFEQANKGTLFLDEIGDMPIELQAKLLRVLQEREVQRLGSSETIKVDVRVIAATNTDLIERVRQGRFREDLYYRLNVVPLHMPALREREGERSLRSGKVAVTPDVSSKLALLKTGVAQALRVADAGAAFYRGLAIRFGNPTHAYNSGGHIQNIPTYTLEHEVIG